jgi:gluconokinase
MQVIIMGVCSCGKSSLGRALAQLHGLPFIEGDDLHPAANVTKMS